MSRALLIGGPLVVALVAWFLIWSGIVVFDDTTEEEGYRAGTETTGTVETQSQTESQSTTNVSQSANYRLEEQFSGFSDVSGLQIEQQSIEYREGNEPTHVRKLDGLNKFTNITLRWPIGFDAENWRFIFERRVKVEEINAEYDTEIEEFEAGGEVEMKEIDPPVLVIPAN